jgi:hypothetical protein
MLVNKSLYMCAIAGRNHDTFEALEKHVNLLFYLEYNKLGGQVILILTTLPDRLVSSSLDHRPSLLPMLSMSDRDFTPSFVLYAMLSNSPSKLSHIFFNMHYIYIVARL